MDKGEPRSWRGARPRPRLDAGLSLAATTAGSVRALKDRLIGDGLVAVASALGRHRDPARALNFPAGRQWIAGETGHLDLLGRRDVYERIAGWIAGGE